MLQLDWKALFSKKNQKNLYIMLIIGIIMVIASNLLFAPKSKSVSRHEVSFSDEADIEGRLEEILGQVAGAGKVRVMVTYDTGPEKVTVSNRTGTNSDAAESDKQGGERQTSESSEQVQAVMVNSGGETAPFISKEIEPKIRGVLVVAEGAANKSVQLNLTNAVSAVLDVPYHRIQVLPKAN